MIKKSVKDKYQKYIDYTNSKNKNNSSKTIDDVLDDPFFTDNKNLLTKKLDYFKKQDVKNDKNLLKTSRKIFFVEHINNKYKIVFTNNETLLISENNYVNHYIYPDKILSYEQYIEIIDFEEDEKVREYIFSLLKRRPYSYKELLDKLINVKGLSIDKAKEILKTIKLQGYDIEANFIHDFINTCYLKAYSKKKVIIELCRNKIKKNDAEDALIDYTDNQDLIDEIIYQYLSLENVPFYKKRSKAYFKLLSLGYDSEEAKNFIYDYLERNDCENFDVSNEVGNIDYDLNTDIKLEKEVEDFIKIKFKNKINKTTIQKTTNHFLKKGYNYTSINEIINNLINKEK